MAFDSLTLNSGSGGSTATVDSFTDTDAVTRVLPYGGVAFGALGGPYTVVTATSGLPVQPQTSSTWAVTDGGGSLTVDGTVAVSGSVAVTGTFYQATQPVSVASTVTVTGAGGTFPVTDSGGSITVDAPVAAPAFVRLSDGTSAITTLPVSLASVPSHAVTNAGTFAVQLQDGSGNALVSDVSGLGVGPNESTRGLFTRSAIYGYNGGDNNFTAIRVSDSGVASVAVSGTVTVGSHEVTNAGAFAVQAAQSGTWNVTNVSGTVSLPTGASTEATLSTLNGKVTACDTGAVVLSSGTVTTVSTVTNLSQLGGAAVAMGTGTRSAGTQRVTIATDDVVPASQSGTWTVQPGNTANTTAWLVTDAPVTSGGLAVSSFLSTAAVQSTAVKAGAGMVYAVEFFNVGAAAVYVRLYNQSTAPADTDTANILWRGLVPGNTAGAGFVKTWDKGLAFSAGIGLRVTGAVADNDATALSANGVLGNVCYK